MMTPKEHFDWATERAMKYIEIGDAQGAFGSFVSDVPKHPELGQKIDPVIAFIGMMEIPNGPQAVKRWIEGFPSP